MKKEWFRFGNTFCPYPFLHQHIDIRKDKRLCCLSTEVIEHDKGFNTDRYRSIRQSMLNNERVSPCSFCDDAEDKKEISQRQKAIKDMQRHDELLMSQIADHNSGKELKPYWYDLRISNNCNLRCKMCSPDNSSSIAKAMGIDQPHLTNEPEISVNPDSIRLYLSGGEPFMIRKFADVLEQVENKDCEVIVNTNATIINDRMITALSRFNDVCMTVSIDGYKDTNAKIRIGSDWESIDSNIDLFKSKGWSIHAQTVIQKDNVNHLVPLAEYIQSKGIKHWSCQEVLGEDDLHWRSNESIDSDSLTKLLNLKIVKNNLQVHAMIQNILAFSAVK